MRWARNRVLAAASRLRDPKYAAAFAAGVAYFVWLAWAMTSGGAEEGDPVAIAEVAQSAGPIVLLLLTVAWWVSGKTHLALAFTPAEVEFLFQAPVTRTTLVHYKLVRSQAGLLPAALVLGAFAAGPLDLPWLLAQASVWMLLTTIHLHQLAAGLVRSAWANQGGAGWRSQWGPAAGMAAMGAGLVWAFAPLGGSLRSVASIEQAWWAFQQAMAHPGAMVLLPFHVALGPLVSGGGAAWAPAALGGMALLALHYVWVMRTDAVFEEAAAEAGVELQALTAALREGRLSALHASRGRRLARPWFRLRPAGHPAVAVFWMNLTQFTRTLGLAQAVILPVLFWGFSLLLGAVAPEEEVAGLLPALVPALLAGMLLVMGPLFLRNDLRTGLQRLELIRPLPLSGRHLAASAMGASAASLTVIVAFLLTTAVVLWLISGMGPSPASWWPWTAYGAALVLTPLIGALGMVVQNGLSVLFPGWMAFGPTQGGGVDQMGGMMVMMLIHTVALALALLVPLVVGGTVGARLFVAMGPWAAAPAAVAALGILTGEVVAGVVLVGDALDDLDPVAAGLLD